MTWYLRIKRTIMKESEREREREREREETGI
jgi:hypothetical protein